MVDGKTVICRNCNWTCSIVDEFCPNCNFNLKIGRPMTQEIQNTSIQIGGGSTRNVNMLRNEVEFNSYLIKIYLTFSIMIFLFLILILVLSMLQMPYSDPITPIFILLIFSFIVIGPLIVLGVYTSYKEQKYYYNGLTPQQIIQQTKALRFMFFKQNDNHYIFKKDNMAKFLIVLVFEKNYFLYYGTKKTANILSKAFHWSVYS